MRMIERGYKFVWCNEAIAYETEPPMRWKRTFFLRRALLRGKVSLRHPTYGPRETARSIGAVVVYPLMLPFLAVLGQHLFMMYLEKLFHHLGRILSLLGVDVIKEEYITK